MTMNKRWAWRCALIGAMTLTIVLQAEELTPRPEPLRITLTLGDGSKVIGKPALAALPLQTDYTKMEIPFAKISALKFTTGTTNVAVTLANGDKLSAVPGVTELRLTTLFGQVTIPLKLVTGLTVSAGGTSAAPREGLVLWFPFDGVQGPEVTDASEHGHTGHLFAGARIVADEGRRRDVLELDGRDAHIPVPGSPEFCLTNATFTFWLKPTQWSCQTDVLQDILSTISYDSFDGWQFYICGQHQIVWHCRTPDDHKELNTAVKLDFDNDADWHFLAFTFAYQDGHYAVTTYCDGKAVKQEEHAAGVMGYSGQIMRIGIGHDSLAAGRGANYPRDFQGRMDDLMLFNRALGAQEIAALYKAQQ
jgi:hypothetical protein